MIPTNDLLAGYRTDQEKIDAAVQRVLQSGWYILGNEVESFEHEFAHWLGARHAVGVANGTDALMLALRAAGVRPGDGVLTVSHTAVATVAAIEMASAVPLLVDVEEQYYTIDPNSLEEGIRKAEQMGLTCRAVVPVHLYGQSCDMRAVCRVAEKYGLSVVEDCSQSHGATFEGITTGTIGVAAAFSLYPTKNLGAIGDAGVIVTGCADLAETVKQMRQYGWRERNNSLIAGVNSRLDELQAAILRVKLTGLTTANERRQSIAAAYDAGLKGLNLRLPQARHGCRHVYHQYVVRVNDRDSVQDRLRRRGVATMVHYPRPVHRQAAYEGRLPAVTSLDVTDRIVSEILSLPMFPGLSDEGIAQTIGALQECVQ